MSTLRNNSDIIKGGHLMVFINNNPVAFATSHSLSKTLNTQQISTKDHGDTAATLPQNITWEITTENLYSLAGYQTLNTAFNSMQEVTLYFGEASYSQVSPQTSIVGEDGATEWQKEGFGETGKAYITSLQVTAAAGDNATFSATFTGNGSLTTNFIGYKIILDATPELEGFTVIPNNLAIPYSMVKVIPDNATHYCDNVNVTTIPQTNISWNNNLTCWTFTMPESDVIVKPRMMSSHNITLDFDPETQLHLSVSATEAIAGTVISITPDETDYYTHRVDVNTTPSTDIAWTSNDIWTFTMPDSDVTISARMKQPYTVTLQTTDPEYWTINKQYAYEGEEITITGLSPNEGGRVETTPYTTVGWNNTNWYFEMPASNVTVICTTNT